MHVVAAVDCDVLSTTPITTTISIVFTNSCRHLWLLCCCVLGLCGLLSCGPYLLSYLRTCPSSTLQRAHEPQPLADSNSYATVKSFKRKVSIPTREDWELKGKTLCFNGTLNTNSYLVNWRKQMSRTECIHPALVLFCTAALSLGHLSTRIFPQHCKVTIVVVGVAS